MFWLLTLAQMSAFMYISWVRVWGQHAWMEVEHQSHIWIHDFEVEGNSARLQFLGQICQNSVLHKLAGCRKGRSMELLLQFTAFSVVYGISQILPGHFHAPSRAWHTRESGHSGHDSLLPCWWSLWSVHSWSPWNGSWNSESYIPIRVTQDLRKFKEPLQGCKTTV